MLKHETELWILSLAEIRLASFRIAVCCWFSVPLKTRVTSPSLQLLLLYLLLVRPPAPAQSSTSATSSSSRIFTVSRTFTVFAYAITYKTLSLTLIVSNKSTKLKFHFQHVDILKWIHNSCNSMEFNRLKQSEFHQCRAEQSRAREKPSLQTDMYFISISIIISSHLKTVTTVEIMIFSLHFGMNGMEWNGWYYLCVPNITFVRSFARMMRFTRVNLTHLLSFAIHLMMVQISIIIIIIISIYEYNEKIYIISTNPRLIVSGNGYSRLFLILLLLFSHLNALLY